MIENKNMGPLRVIGYLGIALLVLLDLFIFWISITEGDLKGLLIGAGFFLLLAFLAYSLRGAAKQESNPDDVITQTLGWHGVPFSKFVHEVMLKSIEGWLVVACFALCLLNIIVLIPQWSWASFLLWGIYPWMPFTIWIFLASPEFQLELFSVRSLISISFLIWALSLPAKSLWLTLSNVPTP